MFLLYHSEGCNICELVLHVCYVNDLYTTTCSGMLGHHIKVSKFVLLVYALIFVQENYTPYIKEQREYCLKIKHLVTTHFINMKIHMYLIIKYDFQIVVSFKYGVII
jgi:hypothetical protein